MRIHCLPRQILQMPNGAAVSGSFDLHNTRAEIARFPQRHANTHGENLAQMAENRQRNFMRG